MSKQEVETLAPVLKKDGTVVENKYYLGGTAKKITEFTYPFFEQSIPVSQLKALIALAEEKGLTWVRIQSSKSATPKEKNGKIISTHSMRVDTWKPDGSQKPAVAPVDDDSNELPF